MRAREQREPEPARLAAPPPTASQVPPALMRGASNHALARALLQRQDPVVPMGPLTAEQSAETILAGATRLLGVHNFISRSLTHLEVVEGVSLSAAERYMLFEFWLAVTGRETDGSTYRRATPAERLARLEAGATRADGVLRQLGPAPWQGSAGDVARAFQETLAAARGRVLDEAVGDELEAQPTPLVYEDPEVELEQQRRTVEDTLLTLDNYGSLASRVSASTASRFGTEIRTALTDVAARAPEGSRLAGLGGMAVPEALLHLRGVLNGINAILTVADDRRRAQLLAGELGVADVAAVSRVLLGLLEGCVAATCLIGSTLARIAGETDVASRLFRLGANNFVRRIGWVASMAQMVHGLSVLFADADATEAQRLQGVFDVAFGAAGVTGMAATLGVEALAGVAGPLSAGIAITAAELVVLRDMIRGMERGMASGGIRASFEVVEYEAGGLAHAANELAEAMTYADGVAAGPSAVGAPGELAAAAQREVQFRSTRLREWLLRSIDRVTVRQPEFAILFQPATWQHVRAPFDALRPQLERARSPEDLLRVAAAYLEAARDLFRNLERTLARTLVSSDRAREGGFLPHPLGGLHGDIEGAAEMPVH